jgi:RecA/RadA recombinase
VKPVDLSKLRKNITKNHKISDGFHDPDTWIDTGNYALNYRISSSFFKGVPLGKVTVFAGESGSGKSYFASGNIVRNAQKQGILPIILDSEFALDEKWLNNLGVDTAGDKLIRYPVSLVDDCADIVNETMKWFTGDYAASPREEQPKILFIIDSLGMLSTPTEVDQFDRGEMKGDMGRKAKQLKALVTQCLKMFGPYNIGMVATNHVYKSQDQFNPDDVISGGSGFVFASSIIVAQSKLKLKEDENGDKVSDVRGIRAKVKVVKSRYAKPFEEVEIQIPYDTGMDPYSGLFEMFEKMGLMTREGNSYVYVDLDGVIHKQFQKAWKKDHEKLQMIMHEIEAKDALQPASVGFDEGVDVEDMDLPDAPVPEAN